MFPFLLILDLVLFNNSEAWVSATSDGIKNLTDNCSFYVIAVLGGISILTCFRPLIM